MEFNDKFAMIWSSEIIKYYDNLDGDEVIEVHKIPNVQSATCQHSKWGNPAKYYWVNGKIDIWFEWSSKYHRCSLSSHVSSKPRFMLESDYKVVGIDIGHNKVPKTITKQTIIRKLNKY